MPTYLIKIAKFFVAGVLNNVVYYGLYLGLTSLGVSYIIASGLMFLFGIVYSFWINWSFIFEKTEQKGLTFVKYTGIYVLAWGLNVLLLNMLVTQLGVDHRIAQGVLIFAIGLFLFFALDIAVFRRRGSRAAPGGQQTPPERRANPSNRNT